MAAPAMPRQRAPELVLQVPRDITAELRPGTNFLKIMVDVLEKAQLAVQSLKPQLPSPFLPQPVRPHAHAQAGATLGRPDTTTPETRLEVGMAGVLVDGEDLPDHDPEGHGRRVCPVLVHAYLAGQQGGTALPGPPVQRPDNVQRDGLGPGEALEAVEGVHGLEQREETAACSVGEHRGAVRVILGRPAVRSSVTWCRWREMDRGKTACWHGRHDGREVERGHGRWLIPCRWLGRDEGSRQERLNVLSLVAVDRTRTVERRDGNILGHVARHRARVQFHRGAGERQHMLGYSEDAGLRDAAWERCLCVYGAVVQLVGRRRHVSRDGVGHGEENVVVACLVGCWGPLAGAVRLWLACSA